MTELIAPIRAFAHVTVDVFAVGKGIRVTTNTTLFEDYTGTTANVTVFGKTFFDLFDYLSSNLLLPLGGLFLAVMVGWFWGYPKMKAALSNEGTLPSRRRSVTISWEGVCRTVTVLTTVEAFDAVLFDPASTCERFVTISETRPKSHPGLRLAQAGDRQRGCARFEMHASVTRAVLVAFLGGPSIACPIELAWSSEGRPAARRFQVTSRQHRASGHRR